MISSKLFLATAAVLAVVVVHAQDITLFNNGMATNYDFETCIPVPNPSGTQIQFIIPAECSVYRDQDCQNAGGFVYARRGRRPLRNVFPMINNSGGSILCSED